MYFYSLQYSTLKPPESEYKPIKVRRKQYRSPLINKYNTGLWYGLMKKSFKVSQAIYISIYYYMFPFYVIFNPVFRLLINGLEHYTEG